MNEALTYLTSLAQALAKMSLYAEGHPARLAAANASFRRLRELLSTNPFPNFSFIDRSVIYGQRPLSSLTDWDWALRFSTNGVQRIEFDPTVDSDTYRGFLEELLDRIALSTQLRERQPRAVWQERASMVRFGFLGVLNHVGDDQAKDAADLIECLDLTEEADVVSWIQEELLLMRPLPLAEAEAVVQSIANAVHGSGRLFVPSLALKEFDQYLITHSINVSALAMALTRRLGLTDREVYAYGMAGLLHDIGNVRVPLQVQLKPGSLTTDELTILQSHTVAGARLILECGGRLDLCAAVALEHHIRVDGGGYPLRHTRRGPHHASRLIHVCDVFDAMRTHRPYRVAWDTASTIDFIERGAGTDFDPAIVSVLLGIVGEGGLMAATARSIDGEVPAAHG